MEKEEQEVISKFIENSVVLQRVMTDVSVNLTRLTKEISELLELFKEAAKHVEDGKDGEIAGKLESISEQNKTIAKSLSLILSEKPNSRTQPLPEFKF
jgi:hypothetical protein